MHAVELTAGPAWQAVDFISDLHLSASDLQTFAAWQSYMQGTAADAMFILGDLFEVWVGDDVLQAKGFEYQCTEVIQLTAKRMPVFFMHGNRDFLAGNALMTDCSATLLADPSVLVFKGQRWLLSHGDALCTGDVDYMKFRQQVRSEAWQQHFLAKPLEERQAIARGLRQQSEALKKSGVEHADVDAQAARQWLQQANAHTLIHGHTHKSATHELGGGLQRKVLSDWDGQATPPRAQVMRLAANGLQRIDLL